MLHWLTSYVELVFTRSYCNGWWIISLIEGSWASCDQQCHIMSNSRHIWSPTGLTVLGPLLFLIYINDIAEVTLSPRSSLIWYANDILYYRAIQESSQFQEVQSDVTTLEKWSNENLLQLNPQKCKLMIMSKKRCPTTYSEPLHLCGSELEEVKFFQVPRCAPNK